MSNDWKSDMMKMLRINHNLYFHENYKKNHKIVFCKSNHVITYKNDYFR